MDQPFTLTTWEGGGFGGSYGGSTGYGVGAYNGLLAAPVFLSIGHLDDTNEIAAADNAHFSALLSAKPSSGYRSGYGGSADYESGSSFKSGSGYRSGVSYGGGAYNGPLAAPVVLSSGYLADTRDVAAAKGAHYVTVSDAISRSGNRAYSGSQGKGWHYIDRMK